MKRWKPEVGEQYYYIDLTFFLIYRETNEVYDTDIDRIKNNNCFKTIKEAKAILKQIKQILKNS